MTKRNRWVLIGIMVMIAEAAALNPVVGFANHYILCDTGQKCDVEGPASGASLAYIGNASSNDLTVIDTRTNAVVGSVDVGQNTFGVAVNLATSRVYAANALNVVVVDMTTNQVVGNIAYETMANLLSTLPVGCPPPDCTPTMNAGVAVNQAGTRVYVTDQSRGGIAVIDTASNTVIASVTTGHAAFDLAVSPDGSRVYATDTYNDTVSVIDALTNTVVANVPIDNTFFSPPITAGNWGAGPVGITVSGDGTRVYVATVFLVDPSHSTAYITVIDGKTNTIIGYVPIGPLASRHVATDPTGTRVYTSGGAIIDTTSDTVIGTIPPSIGFDCGLAVDPTGTKVYRVEEDLAAVEVADARTGAVIATIPVGGWPCAIGQFIGRP